MISHTRMCALATSDSAQQDQQEKKPWALINLPPFPAIAMRIMQLLSRDDVGMKELSEVIRADPAFAAEVLTLANSPLLGIRGEIRTILQATALLGLARVKALALTVSMKVYLTESFQIPALLACWRHSLACALLAEEIATVSMIEKDFAYMAGLVHDVGRLALGMIKPLDYANMLAAAEQQPFDVLARERELFGVDHCEAGRWLSQSWKLPKEFPEIIANHHAEPNGKFDMTALIHLACDMADTLGFAAVRPLWPKTFGEILHSLPAREKARFDPDPDRLATRVATKITSFE